MKHEKLGIVLMAAFLLLCAATVWNFHDKHTHDGVSMEDIVAAYKAADDRQLSVYAQEVGTTLESLKEIARREIMNNKKEVYHEREKCIGDRTGDDRYSVN